MCKLHAPGPAAASLNAHSLNDQTISPAFCLTLLAAGRPHPLDPLSEAEVRRAAAACRAHAAALGLPPLRFNTIALQVRHAARHSATQRQGAGCCRPTLTLAGNGLMPVIRVPMEALSFMLPEASCVQCTVKMPCCCVLAQADNNSDRVIQQRSMVRGWGPAP